MKLADRSETLSGLDRWRSGFGTISKVLIAFVLTISAACSKDNSDAGTSHENRSDTMPAAEVAAGQEERLPAAPAGSAFSEIADIHIRFVEPAGSKKNIKALIKKRIAKDATFMNFEDPEVLWSAGFRYETKSEFGEEWGMTLQVGAHELSDVQRDTVANSEQRTAVRFRLGLEKRLERYRALMEVVAAVAEKTGTILYDGAAIEYLAVETFRKRRVDGWDDQLPKVDQHINIRGDLVGSWVRLTTDGLSRFGLPELEVTQLTRSAARPMGSIVNAVARALLADTKIGAGGAISVTISNGQSEVELPILLRVTEARGDWRLWRIDFPGNAPWQERVTQAMDRVFSPPVEDVRAVAETKAKTLERQANNARLLKEVKPKYLASKLRDQELTVKAKFDAPNGSREWMWLEVTDWKGDTLSGVMRSDPVLFSKIKRGSSVKVKESDIGDYTLETVR